MQVDSQTEEAGRSRLASYGAEIEREALKVETDTASGWVTSAWKRVDRCWRIGGTDVEMAVGKAEARTCGRSPSVGEALCPRCIAQRSGEFQKAGELPMARFPQLERSSSSKRKVRKTRVPCRNRYARPRCISRWTGIPVDGCWKANAALPYGDELAKRVVGQGEAVEGNLKGRSPLRLAGLQDPKPFHRFVHLHSAPRVSARRNDQALAAFFPGRHGHGSYRHVGIHGKAFRTG